MNKVDDSFLPGDAMNVRARATILGTLLMVTAGSLPAWAASDPCSLLTPAQVTAVLGTPVEAAKDSPLLCSWSAPGPPNPMNAKKVALVLSTARAFGFAKTPVASSAKTMPASGVGDDAVYSIAVGVDPGPGTALYVKKGNSYFVIHLYGIPDQAQAMAMEKTLALEVCSHL